jgi:cell volume regulation protein A
VQLQGTTLSYVAKLLHVTVPPKARRRTGVEFESSDAIKTEMKEITLEENWKAAGKRIVELSVPATVTILSVRRNGVFVVPNGSTKLLANDVLQVLAEDQPSLEKLHQVLV